MTFPDDADTVAKIIGEDFMASEIAEIHAQKEGINAGGISDELAGRTVTVTTAELGLVGEESVPEPTTVTITGTHTGGGDE
jgi:hypothetical protein